MPFVKKTNVSLFFLLCFHSAVEVASEWLVPQGSRPPAESLVVPMRGCGRRWWLQQIGVHRVYVERHGPIGRQGMLAVRAEETAFIERQ